MKSKRWIHFYCFVMIVMFGWYLAIQTPSFDKGWLTTTHSHQPNSVADRLEQIWSAQPEPPSSKMSTGWLILFGILITVSLLVRQLESLLKQIGRYWRRNKQQPKRVRPVQPMSYLEDGYDE